MFFSLLLSFPASAVAFEMTVEATPCALQGNTLVPQGERPNISLLAAGAGGLYMYHRPLASSDDGIHRVERWGVDLSGGCALTWDAGFAGDGQLERPGIFGMLGVVGDKLVVGDREETIYSTAGAPLYECDGLSRRSRIAPIDETSDQALVTFSSDAVERWTFGDEACASETLWEIPEKHQVSYYFDAIQGDVVGMYLMPESAKTVARFGADGAEAWRFGSTDADAEHRLRSLYAVTEVGDRVLVLDTGAALIYTLSAAGELLGSLDIRPIFKDLRSWQVVHLVEVADDSALLYLTHVTEDKVVHGQLHRLTVR